MSGIGWRVLALLAFIPFGLLWVVPQFAQIVIAAVAWVLFGPDEARTDRIITGPPGSWIVRPLDYLMNKAGFEL